MTASWLLTAVRTAATSLISVNTSGRPSPAGRRCSTVTRSPLSESARATPRPSIPLAPVTSTRTLPPVPTADRREHRRAPALPSGRGVAGRSLRRAGYPPATLRRPAQLRRARRLRRVRRWQAGATPTQPRRGFAEPLPPPPAECPEGPHRRPRRRLPDFWPRCVAPPPPG